MRLAHFSDIHCTINPLSDRWSRILGKRCVGSLNYFLGGRRTHFRRSDLRIQSLLEDVEAQNVDHVLCTGDVTQMSFEREFETCSNLFGDRLHQSERYTVIPGNHDRYTQEADVSRRFENWFGTVCAQGKFPFVKAIAEGVSLVGLDPCRATSLVDSSGLLGNAQLEELQNILDELGAKSDFVIIALHYGVFHRGGVSDKPRHGLRDFEAFSELVESESSPVRMILHGHMHDAYEVKRSHCTYLCAGSATDLNGACGYNVYDIDVSERRFKVERRVWNRDRKVYDV